MKGLLGSHLQIGSQISCIAVFIVLNLATLLILEEHAHGSLNEKMSKLHIPFIENQGQVDRNVTFYADTYGGTVFVTKEGKLVYSFFQLKDKKPINGITLKEELIRGKVNQIKPDRKSSTRVNYFKGNNPSTWKRNISTYEVLTLGEVYDGIELKLRAQWKNIEKLFYLKPGANPKGISVKLSGAKALNVNRSGELETETELGVIRFTKPQAYQQEGANKKLVKTSYTVSGNEYGFLLGDYDKTKELVIDPLISSTYLGGSLDDGANYLAIQSKDVYVAGFTFSANFPTTDGAFDVTSNGDVDGFVSKLSGDLRNLEASTYLGGTNGDGVGFIIINGSSVYITGSTDSSDFPTTSGAFATTFGGSTDAFVSKLNRDLTDLLASTYLGGSGFDATTSMTVKGNKVYVAGGTFSSNFPTTPDAFDIALNGGPDAFVTQLGADLNVLIASTYLGGGDSDRATTLDIHGANVYVAGFTFSFDFPTTPDAFDTSLNGFDDAFVSKLSDDLETLHASTYLGGAIVDLATTISVGGRNVYVAGSTNSADFPVSDDAFDTTLNLADDAFVSKLDADLSTLVASTYLGRSFVESPSFIAIKGRNIYVTGRTSSPDFPTTPGAFDTTFNGVLVDAFVSKLKADLTTLLASTYLGGSDNDNAASIAVKGSKVYVTGVTTSLDFPTTPDAFATFNGGLSDAFISKLDSDLSD